MDRKVIQQLLRKKNVVSVGTGIKTKGGVSTHQPAVVVGVRKKVPRSELAARDIVPETIDRRVSDVIEVGELKALSVYTAPGAIRVRPCPGGVSCGSYRITAGTLGAWVKKDGQPHLLSNNHVLAAVNQGREGDSILQPGTHDGGRIPLDDIAALATFVPIQLVLAPGCLTWFLNWLRRRSVFNTVDCALARPLPHVDAVDWAILGCGIPHGISDPWLGLVVKKSGRTTGLTQAVVTQVDVTARVNMGAGEAIFTEQFAIESAGFSGPGDSGSVILSSDNRFVGLLFAGGQDITLANKFSNVAKALGG